MEFNRALGIAQNHRVRFNMGRGVGEADVVDSTQQIQREMIAHGGEVLVVDRQRKLRVTVGCESQDETGGKKQRRVHGPHRMKFA